MQSDLSATKAIVNVEVTKILFCFVYDDRKKDEILSRITGLARGETFPTIFI